MKLVFSRIDFAIRIAAAVVVSTLGMAMLLLACAMGTDSGTAEALAVSAGVFVLGICVFGAVLFLAVAAERLEKYIPGPSIIGKILVRIPTYLCGTGGLFLLLRQIWLVAIPDLLR